MFNEVEKIFYNQFRETKNYYNIINLIMSGLINLENLSKKTGVTSGGGLKRYLTNLELVEIIRKHIPFNKKQTSKIKKYAPCDEFLIFYYKYIDPNKRTIEESSNNRLFEKITRANFDVWLGFAFEKFCIKHAHYIASKMGFADEIEIVAPYFEKNDNNFQIDLIYKRFDKVITICEVKYHNREISKNIIPEIERKIKLLKIPRGYFIETALISIYGPDSALMNSGFFDHYINIDDIIAQART